MRKNKENEKPKQTVLIFETFLVEISKNKLKILMKDISLYLKVLKQVVFKSNPKS